MDELTPIYLTAGLMVAYLLVHLATREFDPFAPVWLFLIGYAQVYVIQALSYHDWAIEVRGKELVMAANQRSLWALGWFLAAYQLPIGRLLAPALPAPPKTWSPIPVAVLAPPLVAWGLFCSGILIRGGLPAQEVASAEESLFRSFPFVMLVAAVLLMVTGRSMGVARPLFLPAGLLVAGCYVAIWMFNGKRSHSLIGVLATVCTLYITRLKRPSWPVLAATLGTGALVVGIAIGWRNNPDYDRSFSGFTEYLAEFEVAKVLESLNIEEEDALEGPKSHETTEYGGFLLMMDTVPHKSDFDLGRNYIRVFSTFIPRLLWPSKPLFGREQWVSAWIAGSELPREDDFTGPAIGILGAAQLNGGALGTTIVLGAVGVALRVAYEYFRRHAQVPWTQFWWAITFYNSWFMVVGDDPLTWFYYNWGFSTLPIVILFWWVNRLLPPPLPRREEPTLQSEMAWS